MCVKLKGNKMTPGQVQAFLTKLGKASGVWGFDNGRQANVRIESLDTVWRGIKMNRGILSVESFWEKDKEFVRSDGKLFMLGVIFDEQYDFAVITVPANELVKPVHHRMPACLVDDRAEDFIEGKLPILMNAGEMIYSTTKVPSSYGA
jgi:putative SOS response-associated peptidase YedK